MTSSQPQALGGIGGKIKGAAQIVHGLGDIVRGEALHLVDSISNNEQHRAAHQRSADIAEQGRRELSAGFAGLRGGPPAAAEEPYQRGAEGGASGRAGAAGYASGTSYGGGVGQQGDAGAGQPQEYGDVKRRDVDPERTEDRQGPN